MVCDVRVLPGEMRVPRLSYQKPEASFVSKPLQDFALFPVAKYSSRERILCWDTASNRSSIRAEGLDERV